MYPSQHFHQVQPNSGMNDSNPKMETAPLVNERRNVQQARDQNPIPAYGTTTSSPPGCFADDFPPSYTRTDAEAALQSGLYPHPPTVIDLAEIEYHATRISKRRILRYLSRPRYTYTVEFHGERNLETELHTLKSACWATAAIIFLVIFGFGIGVILHGGFSEIL